MNRTLQVVKLGGMLYWREKATVFGTAVTPLLLGVGLPLLMHRVLDARQALAVFHGMLAVVLAISGFMAITVSLTARRDSLVLKRLRTTELTDRQILAGEVANVAVQTVLLIALITVAVHLLTGVPLPRDPLLYGVFVVAGAVVVALLGVAWSAAVPRAELAAPMTVPFFMLAGAAAGTFGPIMELLPSWADTVAALLPTSAVVEVAKVAYAPGDLAGDLAAACRPLLVLAGWGVAGLAATARWFRWEPRRS